MSDIVSVTPFRDHAGNVMIDLAKKRLPLPLEKRRKLHVLSAMWPPAGWGGNHLRVTISYHAIGSIGLSNVLPLPNRIILQVGAAA
jgi:hypothetical protein